MTSSSTSTLANVAYVASIVAASGIAVSVGSWLWRRSRRWIFPNIRIEVTGVGFATVPHVRPILGAAAPLAVPVHVVRRQVNIVSREPDRNSVLTFTMIFRGPDGREVIWAPPQWNFDERLLDERLPVLHAPVNVGYERAVSGVLVFEVNPFPIDESVAPRLQIHDHVSRTRVRIPSELGDYDRGSWERMSPRSRPGRWWKAILDREDKFKQDLDEARRDK